MNQVTSLQNHKNHQTSPSLQSIQNFFENYGPDPASSTLHQPIDVEATFYHPKNPAHHVPPPSTTPFHQGDCTEPHSAVYDTAPPYFSPDHPAHLPRCLPKSFITSTGREVQITQIGLIHPKYNGLKTTFLFDVTDGTTDYRLSFDTESLSWFLEWQGDDYI